MKRTNAQDMAIQAVSPLLRPSIFSESVTRYGGARLSVGGHYSTLEPRQGSAGGAVEKEPFELGGVLSFPVLLGTSQVLLYVSCPPAPIRPHGKPT